jgi:hypothetical protein
VKLSTGLLAGAAAGAAGTTALNAVTYLDMAVRGRPSSSTPEQTVDKLAARSHLRIPGDEETRGNRLGGLGALAGILAGVGLGAALGAARAAGWRPGLLGGSAVACTGALLVGNGPMTVLGVTDPRSWSATDWVSDLVPHLAYGAVTAGVLHRLTSGNAASSKTLLFPVSASSR